MLRHPPISTRTDTLVPYTTLCLSEVVDVPDFVVQKINLAAALEFAQAGLVDQRIAPFGDEGLERDARRRRCGDDRKVAQAGETHEIGRASCRERVCQYV